MPNYRYNWAFLFMSTSPLPRWKMLYQTIIQSLKGGDHDYTEGSISKAVVLLAVPMILELSLESVFAVVDIFFVSKLGAYAIATVGLTESVITIIYSLAIGLSTAATAIVARRTGEKRPEDASKAAAQSIVLAMACTIILSLVGVIFPGEILAMMGADAQVIKEGAIFTRIMFGGSISIMLIFLINGIFRGAGNAAIAMKSLWLASIINIILCPILIHYMGLKGAAIATVIGRSTGVFYQIYALFNAKNTIKLLAEYFKPNVDLLKQIIKLAWPATFQFIIASGSWIVMAKLVAEIGGTNATAGYQIAIRNVVFFILPAWGLSNAAATLVGQNLGAKKLDRAEKSVEIATKFNAYFMGFVMILFLSASPFIINFFTKDPLIAKYGINALRIIGLGYIFYGIGMVMTQALNGAGDTKTPTIINFVCFWLVQIPLAFVLSRYSDFDTNGIFMAIPLAETAIALLAWYYFKRGKWKYIQV